MNWSYGVLTTPRRRGELLPRTLASLRAGGFTSPRLFVDEETDGQSWVAEFGLSVATRWPRVGVAANWLMSALELFLRAPHADAYGLFQDDLVCVGGLMPYLEASSWPGGRGARYLSLYAPPSYCELLGSKRGWLEAPSLGPGSGDQMGRSAVALIFDNQTMATVVSSLFFVERFRDYSKGWKGVDQAIVQCLNRKGCREYTHLPSLVQHTGQVSTIDKRHKGDGMGVFPEFVHTERWQSPSFPGEGFDARKLLEG